MCMIWSDKESKSIGIDCAIFNISAVCSLLSFYFSHSLSPLPPPSKISNDTTDADSSINHWSRCYNIALHAQRKSYFIYIYQFNLFECIDCACVWVDSIEKRIRICSSIQFSFIFYITIYSCMLSILWVMRPSFVAVSVFIFAYHALFCFVHFALVCHNRQQWMIVCHFNHLEKLHTKENKTRRVCFFLLVYYLFSATSSQTHAHTQHIPGGILFRPVLFTVSVWFIHRTKHVGKCIRNKWIQDNQCFVINDSLCFLHVVVAVVVVVVVNVFLCSFGCCCCWLLIFCM